MKLTPMGSCCCLLPRETDSRISGNYEIMASRFSCYKADRVHVEVLTSEKQGMAWQMQQLFCSLNSSRLPASSKSWISIDVAEEGLEGWRFGRMLIKQPPSC